MLLASMAGVLAQVVFPEVITFSANSDQSGTNTKAWNVLTTGTGGHVAKAVAHGLNGVPFISITGTTNTSNMVVALKEVAVDANYITLVAVTITPGSQIPDTECILRAMSHTIVA